jgi:hypothetical protein
MKKILVLSLGLLILSGCQQPTIVYEGKEKNTSDVEEIIADKLEVENPNLDLEVNITEDSD